MLALAIAALAAPGAADERARARTIDATTISCRDFLALTPLERTRVALWLDGWVKATRNTAEQVGDTAWGQPLDPVVTACEAAPGEKMGAMWMAHYPGRETAVSPTRAPCSTYLAANAATQAGLVAWLEGFRASQQRDVDAVPRVDLGLDPRRFVKVCRKKPAVPLARHLGIPR